ncbi:hypothetical protein Poly41_06000 [Novipirellula artificiosorum]|uniref:Uncharacterized protein n=1 Tax=Novipirellula artificiosorum TaxID=2528016 RepID=A0A5C6E1E8_9BACT|nr:hypothetical protein Poly41_06000 [Novipirellula artificiosorum]
MSHHCWQELFSLVIVQLPGETEWSSAEVQLDKGYPGRRCAKGATGPRRTTDRRGLFSKRALDTGAIPPKNLESGFRALPSDEPIFFRFYKQLMGGAHLISHSDNGIEIQVYCSMIACRGKKGTGVFM